MQSILEQGAAAVCAAAAALPERGDLVAEEALAEEACRRGYFLPDEEDVIRLRYSQYLGLRAALLETLESLSIASGRGFDNTGRGHDTCCLVTRFTHRRTIAVARRGSY